MTTATQEIRGIVDMDQIGAVITPYNFLPDESIKLEDVDGASQTYPGDKGAVYEFPLRLTIRDNGNTQRHEIPVICFTGELERELEIARLIWGAGARNQYTRACATVAKAIKGRVITRYRDEVEGIFGPDSIKDTCEYLVLRAGRVMTLRPFFPDLETREADCKREPTDDGTLYRGKVIGTIPWGNETSSVGGEICIASGANMKAFLTDRAKNKKNCKGFLLNTIFISIEGLKRSLPALLKNGIQPIIICWGGIFNVYEPDITFPNGEVVHGGTLISIYPGLDKDKRALMTEETYQYIISMYGDVPVLPDLNGELGDKIQSNLDLVVVPYDILELTTLGVKLYADPWREKVIKAFAKSPGSLVKLMSEAPTVYAYLASRGLINPTGQMSDDTEKEDVVEVEYGG